MLGEVTAATAQAVANTVKRVVILLATVAFLGESMDVHKASGAAVAIGATMMYSHRQDQEGECAGYSWAAGGSS